MTANAPTAPAFYQSSSPPPTLPLLASQTDLSPNTSPIIVVAHQELLPHSIPRVKPGEKPAHHSANTISAPYTKAAVRKDQRRLPTDERRLHTEERRRPAEERRLPTDEHRVHKDERFSRTDATGSGVPEPESESESQWSSSDNVSETGRIPKPDGEPGRPGRGGYNLQEALAWDSKSFQRLKVRHIQSLRLPLVDAFAAESRPPSRRGPS
jgi:hypothetical protein